MATRKSPSAFNLPPKGKKAAIIGGGLSGLGCAMRLLNRKYDVDIYEKQGVLGGEARTLMDHALFDDEIYTRLNREKPVICLNTEVKDLETVISSYDAVYIATGRDGSDFDAGRGSGAYATGKEGVFIGGGVTGLEVIPALADGIRAALAIERYLKTGLMNEPEDTMDTKLALDLRFVPESVPVQPKDSELGLSAEEAKLEAGRCRRCSCDICMHECDLMRIQQKTPGRLYEESYITVRPSTLANDGRWATRRIASCDQCGLCRTVCPQRIDMGKFLLQCHHGLKETDAMPWVFHDYWLRDMEFAAGEASLQLIPACADRAADAAGEADLIISEKSSDAGCLYAFFPGCQSGASDPRYVSDCYEWILEKQPGTAMWLDCCGVPAVWAAEDGMYDNHLEALRRQWQAMGRPRVVFACPTCRKMFTKELPEIEGVFIEELMLKWGLPEIAQGTGAGNEAIGSLAVFDPCGSRGFPELQEAVRRLAAQTGINYDELSHSGELARCCSFGGQYSIAAPDYAKRVRMERAEESPLPYLTYCVNCRDAFASRGKECLHILDLVFGRRDLRREEPTASERRENRLRLKAELILKYRGDEMNSCIHCIEDKTAGPELLIDRGLEKKLSDLYILTSEMAEVIGHCEREHSGVINPANGHITGHLKIGHMTYWAEYEPLADGRFRLHNGYAHRMNLEGE